MWTRSTVVNLGIFYAGLGCCYFVNLIVCVDGSTKEENECGVRLGGAGPITFKIVPPVFKPQMLGKPFECSLEFEAGNSMYVDVQVLELKMPSAQYDERKKNCTMGSLKIFDGVGPTQVWAPTEICGTYERGVGIRRITSFNAARVVFKVVNLTATTSYQLKVKFVNIDSHSEYHYGNYFDVDGREKIRGRRICDWRIAVEKCLTTCDITSPGFPGIYPPFSECTYRLINHDSGRVHLQLGSGKFTGKFNLRKSAHCDADYVNVYDGDSTRTPLVGSYCGNDGVEVISSGSALTVEFVSSAGGPPWDYTGFDGRVSSRNVDEPNPSKRRPRSRCSWDFDSSQDPMQGVVLTPDYHLPDHQTDCYYSFTMKDGDAVELDIVISQLSGNCKETLEIRDGPRRDVKRLCDEPELRNGKRLRLLFNNTSQNLIIRYTKSEKQTFNDQPIAIRYAFKRRVVGSRGKAASGKMGLAPPVVAVATPGARTAAVSNGQADSTLPLVSASVLFVFIVLSAIFCCR